MRIVSTVLLFLLSTYSMAADFMDFEISANQMSSYYRAYIFFDGDKKYKKPISRGDKTQNRKKKR